MENIVVVLNSLLIPIYLFGVWAWLTRMNWQPNEKKFMWLAPIWPVVMVALLIVKSGLTLGVLEFKKGEKVNE